MKLKNFKSLYKDIKSLAKAEEEYLESLHKDYIAKNLPEFGWEEYAELKMEEYTQRKEYEQFPWFSEFFLTARDYLQDVEKTKCLISCFDFDDEEEINISQNQIGELLLRVSDTLESFKNYNHSAE